MQKPVVSDLILLVSVPSFLVALPKCFLVTASSRARQTELPLLRLLY